MATGNAIVIFVPWPSVDSTSTDDKRITFIGQTIRRFKIDELTQLWNVLLGDMSIVGRRPTVREHYDFYTHDVKNIISKYKSVLSFWQYKQLLHGYYINIGTHHLRNFQNKQALFFFLKCIIYSFPFIKYKEFLGLLIALLPNRMISYILHKYYNNK